jgi:hypothetical protein
MLSHHLKTSSFLLLLAFLTYGCAEPSLSDVRIERFEKLDEQPYRQCYLVYGYHPSLEKEVGALIDRYVCNSIVPNLTFDSTGTIMRSKYLYFFKRTKHSNNDETYRSDMKKAIADRDIIFKYVFDVEENIKFVPDRKISDVNGPNRVSEPFTCE